MKTKTAEGRKKYSKWRKMSEQVESGRRREVGEQQILITIYGAK
jgi:hypothetical protein